MGRRNRGQRSQLFIGLCMLRCGQNVGHIRFTLVCRRNYRFGRLFVHEYGCMAALKTPLANAYIDNGVSLTVFQSGWSSLPKRSRLVVAIWPSSASPYWAVAGGNWMLPK
jgi:hypothetical protein